ncbi:MAG: transcription antitermination factor NusB [Bacteroidales bacterium]|nr:transcription antitermination factor NusB [Bacteroidales bacterium]
MISRRLIRTKILQILYAISRKEDTSLAAAEKELFLSLQKAYDLYHLMLLIPIELCKVNEWKIEVARQKLRPTYEDLHPNMRFVNNRLIELLRINRQLQKYISENKIGWAPYADMFRSLFNNVQQRSYFVEYMSKSDINFKDDVKVVSDILENEIPQWTELEIALEEMSIFWNDDLDFVLGMALKTIKGMKESDTADKPILSMYKTEEDIDFARKLLRKAILNRDEYHELIRQHSQNWEFDRIALMDLLIMQLALAEILEFQTIPIKVSFNEYIELAKIYSTENSNHFINGILDHIVKELKNQNKIIKIGKGLIET